MCATFYKPASSFHKIASPGLSAGKQLLVVVLAGATMILSVEALAQSTGSTPGFSSAAKLYQDARLDYSRGRVGAAVRRLETLIKRYPDSPFAIRGVKDLKMLDAAPARFKNKRRLSGNRLTERSGVRHRHLNRRRDNASGQDADIYGDSLSSEQHNALTQDAVETPSTRTPGLLLDVGTVSAPPARSGETVPDDQLGTSGDWTASMGQEARQKLAGQNGAKKRSVGLVPPKPARAGNKSATQFGPAAIRRFNVSFKRASSDRIFFGAQSAGLGDRARNVIESQAAWLLQHKQIAVQIAGHADDGGSKNADREMSRLRAEAVRAFFVARGVDIARITVKAHGRAKRIAICSASYCAAQNRRVVIKVISN